MWATSSTLSPLVRCASSGLPASGKSAPCHVVTIYSFHACRYITFLYNAEAVHFQLHPSQVVAPAGLLDNGGMLFEPLRYDAQV